MTTIANQTSPGGDPAVVLPDLTARERELVVSARRGTRLVCGELATSDLAYTEDPQYHIRAELVRELLLGRYGPLDPRGIGVAGARLLGILDLDFIRAHVSLGLFECVLDGPLLLRGAHVPRINLSGSQVASLYADQLHVDGDLFLRDGFRATGAGEDGAVRLLGAHIRGQLVLSDANLINESGPALLADSLQVDGGLFLGDKFSATGAGELGTVRLLGAQVCRQMDVRAAMWINETGPALLADSLQVDGGLFLGDGFSATGAGEDGTMRIRAARFEGEVEIGDANVINETGPALLANSLQVDGGLFLGGGFSATGAGEHGAVQLMGAHIGGMVGLADATLSNGTGSALNASGLQAGGGLFLGDKFSAMGAGLSGTVRLTGVQIGRTVDISGANLINESGPALCADELRVDGAFVVRDGFQATGAGQDGTVRLLGAQFTGSVSMTEATLTNETGSALFADGLKVDGDLFLGDGFQATGAGQDGTVRLRAAHISGQFDMRNAVVEGSGLLVDVARVTVEGGMFFRSQLICPSRAAINRCSHSERRIDLDELTYGSLHDSTWQEWLHVIRFHTAAYTPSPYQRLAAVERTAGHDGNARRILIAQQQDLHARGALGGWFTRFTHDIWGVVAGYGYRARRTAMALLLALTLAATLGWWAGHWVTGPGHHAAERTPTSGSPAGTPCSAVEQIGLGVDRGLPLAPAGVRARCDLDTASTAGQWFTVAIWVLQAIVWALATLALAGYTGLIRKPA